MLNSVLAVEIPYHKEIIIVDDCSTDGTREILATLQQEAESKLSCTPLESTFQANSPTHTNTFHSHTKIDGRLDSCAFQSHSLSSSHTLKIIYHNVNQGKGAALRSGITHASGEVVLIQDADLEYDPNEYPKLLAPFEKGVADVVFGSRFVSGDSHRVLYFWHRMGNGLLTLFSNMMTNLNLTDMETCYKVFKREIIQNIMIEENRFGFEPEITAKIAKIKGIRIYEVGISYYGRTYEEGKKIGIRDGFRALWAIVKYRFKG